MATPKEQEVVRIVPPPEVFVAADKPILTHQIGPGQLTTPCYRVDTPPSGGIFTYHVGDMHPVKGWPFREAVYAIDSIKRVLINALTFITSSPVRYLAALFFLLPDSLQRKVMRSAVVQFTDFASIVFDRWGRIMQFDANGVSYGIEGLWTKPQYYCDMVREFRRAALPLTENDKANVKLVDTISMLLEHDDGYRYPVQDLFGAMDREAFLRNPGKETARLFRIAAARASAGPGLARKFEQFAFAAPFLFRIRSLRDTATSFVRNADLSKLALDDVDWYRCLLWNTYDFGGIRAEERRSLRMTVDAGWNIKVGTNTQIPWTTASMTSAPQPS